MIALSITESGYIVIIDAIKEVLWFRVLLDELGFLSDNVIV